jgi:hypothetical protein
MKLQTQCYIPARETPDVEEHSRFGLPDLRRGLNGILLGYLVSIGAVLVAAAIVILLIVEATSGQMSRVSMENASLVLFTLVLLLPLAGIASLILIIRGKWLCLMSAPEQYLAKWMMFLSILCILAGPVLNFGANFLGDDKPKFQSRSSHSLSVARIQRELDEYKEYKHGLPELDTRAYVRLIGQGIGMLSGVFFVLFLRAVALTCGGTVRARLAELYLIFIALLVVGVAVLIRHPSYLRTQPHLLLGLGLGWLLAGLWYFVLILSTSISITITLARNNRPREATMAPSVGTKFVPQKKPSAKREGGGRISPLHLG